MAFGKELFRQNDALDLFMDSTARIKVLVLGAGNGGTRLLQLFSKSLGVEVSGVADINPKASGLRVARALNIPIAHSADDLVKRYTADLIIDVTGDGDLPSRVRPLVPTGTAWLGGTAARLMWLLVQHEQDLRTQLIHADKLSTLGTFAAQIAHDLRSPLYCIREFARFIEEEDDLPRVREYSQEIQKADRYLTEMIEELSRYSRRPSDEIDAISLPELMDQALYLSRYAGASQEIEVVRRYAAVPPLQGSRCDFLQMFINLISNALQAMDGRGRLTLTIESSDHHIITAVTDTGSGIPPEHLRNLFVPFFTTKAPAVGTGLGLSIVQTHVTKYGGDIHVESDLGKGTTFRIRFPLVPG